MPKFMFIFARKNTNSIWRVMAVRENMDLFSLIYAIDSFFSLVAISVQLVRQNAW